MILLDSERSFSEQNAKFFFIYLPGVFIVVDVTANR